MQVILVQQGRPFIQQLHAVDLLGRNKHRRTHQVEHIVDVAAFAHRHRHKQVVGQDRQDGTEQHPAHRFINRNFLDVFVRVPEGDGQAEGVGIGDAQEYPRAAVRRQLQPESGVGHGQVAVFPVVLVAGLALIYQHAIPLKKQLDAVHQR